MREFNLLFSILVILVWLLGPVLINLATEEQSFLVSFAVLLLMLACIQDYLDRLVRPPTVSVEADQQENSGDLITQLKDTRIEQVHMIEYDSESVKDLIFFFLRQGADVHCLLQHPDTAINDSQRRRIVLQIKTRDEEYAGYLDKVHFSYYKDVASLRGRRVDDKWLSLGWYTYDHRGSDPGRQVWGHNNPVLIADLQTAPGQILGDFFSKLYDNLCANAETWEQLYDRYELYITSANREEMSEKITFRIPIPRLIKAIPPQCDDVEFTALKPDELTPDLCEKALPIIATCFDDRRWDRRSISEGVFGGTTLARIIVARQESKLVGLTTLHRVSDPSIVKLHWLAVAPSHQNKGIGRSLVIKAGIEASSDGFQEITLRTERFRTAAIAMYSDLGFQAGPV